MSRNVRAHRSTHLNTIAKGRYSAKILARSANSCCRVSAVLMYFAKPRLLRIISRPVAVRRGIAPENTIRRIPASPTGNPMSPAAPGPSEGHRQKDADRSRHRPGEEWYAFRTASGLRGNHRRLTASA